MKETAKLGKTHGTTEERLAGGRLGIPAARMQDGAGVCIQDLLPEPETPVLSVE